MPVRQTVSCEHCDSPVNQPRQGRRATFCSTVCRQAAHRARKKTAATSTAPASRAADLDASLDLDLDETLAEMVKDLQEDIRRLGRAVAGPNSAQDALRASAQLGRRVECVTAGIVARARGERLTWAVIGKALNIGADTARHRYTRERIARQLKNFLRRPIQNQGGPAPGAPATELAVEVPGSAVSRPAVNRLAPVLSDLARGSRCTLTELASRVNCSPSYLSRILTGDRVPSWVMTERFARACGADSAVLRRTWETERLRESPTEGAPAPAGPPEHVARQLKSALRTLHVRAGLPAGHEIAAASDWRLRTAQVIDILTGTGTTVTWPAMRMLVLVLGGDETYFASLWQAAGGLTATIDYQAAPDAGWHDLSA